ncbi:MAG: glycerol-3-phosphate acyltransferase [Anaerolineales bacterium]|nr:glycerol-3-phosphate acyltransferase [Anaerolineales bacterium]
MTIVYFLLAALIGYICGAIPFGYLYVKATKGINILEYGSGRTGGTNTYRAAGVTAGIVTALLDVLKGATAVWVTRALFGDALGQELLPWALSTAGVMSVIGHNWSVFLGFRGGAGTGPNVGWAAAIWWPIFPIAFIVMVGMLVGLGMASIASLTMALVIPVSFIILYAAGIAGYSATLAYIVGGLASLAIVTWALRTNLKRVIAGNERLVGPRAKAAERKQQNAKA